MVSFLRSPFQPPRYAVLFAVLGLLVPTTNPNAARAQTPALEPVEPTARVVSYGSGSSFDLAELGPDFSAPWLTAAVPMLARASHTPALVQRTTTDRASGMETRTTYERASDGRLLAQRVEQRQGATWTPVQRIVYNYEDGVLTAQRTEAWTDGAWISDQRITLKRARDGAVRTVVQQVRNGTQWTNEARLTIRPIDTGPAASPDSPDAQRRLVRATWRNGKWEQAARITFSVTEDSRLITQHNETWTGSGWVNGIRLTYMYDGAGYPIERSLAVWVGGEWIDGPLHLYDYYVRGERVEQRTETWVGTRHLRTSRSMLTYADPVQVSLLGSASFD